MGLRGALRGILRLFASLFRVAAALVLALLLAGAGAGIYLYRHFSPEAARGLAADQLSSLLGREVSIERLALSPGGVKVLGLRVRAARGRPGQDLLSCDSALVTIRLAPLLRRRLEFGQVRLRAPRISVVRGADGAWSFADVFGSSAAVSGARRASLPLALAAAETVVEDGVLRVDDRLRGRVVVLGRLSLRVRGFDLARPFPVRTSFTSDLRLGSRSFATRVAAEGQVSLAGLDWTRASASASSLRVELEGAGFTGRAAVHGFSAPRVETDLRAPPLGPEFWRRLAGRAWPLSLPASRWTLRGGLPAPGMADVEKLVVVTPAGRAAASGVFDAASSTPALSVELSVRDADLARIARWYAPWGRRALTGRAELRLAITGWPGRLQAREGELMLKDFGARWGVLTVSGVDASASASDEFGKVSVAVSSGHAQAFGEAFDDVSLASGVSGQDLSVDRLAARWNGSSIRLRARVAHLSHPKEVLLSGSVDKLDWERTQRFVEAVRAALPRRPALPRSSKPHHWVRLFKYSIPHGFPDTAVHVHVGEVSHPNFWCRNVDLIWSLKNVTPALDRVSGEGRLSFGPGRVKDIPAVQSANPFLRVIFLPFVYMHKMNSLSVFSAATAYPKTLDFDRIEGEYGINRGVAVTRYFHVASGQLEAYAEGSADFGREQVDMNILTRLSSFRGVLPEWWVDEAGRPAIGFRVKGDLNHPELSPRFKKIGATEIEQKVAEGRARARQRYQALERMKIL